MKQLLVFALPLAAALTYVAAALFLKRSADLGAKLLHSTFVSNLLAGIIFQGLLVFGGHWQPLSEWWQPLLVAGLFIGGQALTLFSLQRGDVSIATPVLGLKIILVALFTTVITGQTLSWQLWLAAGLSTTGIICLNHSRAHKAGTNANATIISAGCAAAAYALFDVLVQKWSPAWGSGRFLPLTAGIVGLFAFTLIPFFPAPLWRLPRPTLTWLIGGGTLFALQSLLIVSAIGFFGQATSANIVYSSRGVWSILAVALLGHWFHNTEKNLDRSILRWRFAGATLMFIAIVLVIVTR